MADDREITAFMGKILAVGDRESDRDVVVALLREYGHDVGEASDAADALPAALSVRPDVVVTDIASNDELTELLTLIRCDSALSATPVVICTPAHRVLQTRRLAAAFGVSLIVTKPPRPEALLEAIAFAAQGEDRPASSRSGFFGAILPRYLRNLQDLGDRLQRRMDHAIEHRAAASEDDVGQVAWSFHAFNLRLAALLELNVALSSERDADAMLDLFCAKAQEIMGCRYAAIGILDPGGSTHVALASRGLDDVAQARLKATDPSGTVLGAMLSSVEPLRVAAEDGRSTTLGLPDFHPPIRNLMAVPVPIRSANALSGWVYFADKGDEQTFDAEDEQLVATMVAQFVLAYGNLTLYEEVQRHASALEAEVAEHRMTAQALSDSEQRFRQIASHVESALALIEPDSSRIHYVSPAYEKIWGRTCASLYDDPHSWMRAIHADDRQQATETIIERSQAGHKFELDFRLLRPDGSTCWVHLRSFPIYRGNRKPYRTVVVAVDVTAEMRAQRELQASNRRFTDLLDSVQLISVMLDRNARPTYCNEYLLRLTGWTREEVIGGDFIEQFLPPADVAESRRIFSELVSGGGTPKQRDYDLLTRSGERRLVRWHNTLLHSPGGEIVGVACIGEDVTDQRRAENELAYSLTHDLTTGLPRFSQVEEYLQSALADAAAHEGRVIVAYVDMDRFHTVNETRGRLIGDYALRAVAARLEEITGNDGRVAHVAGDEFAIVLRDPLLAHDQYEFGESIRAKIEEPIEHNSRTIYATCSVGVSCFPDNGSSPQELVRQAESAMLKAKKEGRNTVFAFANEHKQELEDRYTLGLRLDDALKNGEFILHYQPRISGQDWRIGGFEALMRWESPEFGLLSPKRFQQVAEDLGMMVDIGSLVLRTACQQARSWIDLGADEFSISINVSPMQMQRANFVDELRRALADARLPARYIELELTEGMTMGNFERVLGTMRALKALGVKLSLDDFGTGYSSLNYLRKFPIDTLKIDQSFVHDITTDVGATGVCRAIITLAHQLGMTVLAEGVETAAQVGYLRRNDCDFFQGYYFCKPVTAAQAFEILQHRYLPHEGLEQAAAQPTLLLVDDEENILNALSRMLRRDGYRILTAKSADEALDILARNDVQVILSDQRMPGASGTEFLSKVKDMYPDTIRMVLSGYTELAAVTAAINQGAIYKFITKPWNDEELRMQIRDAFRISNRPNDSRKREAT